MLPIKVRWVCQVAPSTAYVPQLATADLGPGGGGQSRSGLTCQRRLLAARRACVFTSR